MKKLSQTRFNEISAEIAEANKPKPPKPPVASLTPEQACAIVKPWIIPLLHTELEIGNFLLLITVCLTEQDSAKKEAILYALIKLLMPYVPAFDHALDHVVAQRLKEIQGV